MQIRLLPLCEGQRWTDGPVAGVFHYAGNGINNGFLTPLSNGDGAGPVLRC